MQFGAHIFYYFISNTYLEDQKYIQNSCYLKIGLGCEARLRVRLKIIQR